tara:strand:- start:50235 stop:51077 length:843 start_codon:yes stop_codon:yes gene_type:complete
MIKQNPFSVYDFLGYLIPGSLFIYCFLIIDYLKKNNNYEIKNILSEINSVGYENIFFFIIISYSLGHILSFSSSVTVEKYANWKYDFPSKYLLNFEYKGYWNKKLKLKSIMWRFFLLPILFPCAFLDYLIGNLFGFKKFYTSSVDVFLEKVIKYKVDKLLDKLKLGEINDIKEFKDGKAKKYDFHRLITHYAYENSKNHQGKMSNYVALYGFLRNLCFIFNFLTIYFFLRVCLFLKFDLVNTITLIILSILTYISFMAFMKFYRRYTLEGFMVIAIDKNL